ncbi:hypothetical protein EJ063_08805 [Vibrio aquaticus]|uniref:Uncharacterized protein n=1 Tax=Vibrio aquaticus TaxID=2496559 RepID=A0A3S0PQA4_9VIBR|nr:hypothetical protein [Vibrio aquaticus]RTZ16876.1 hypothetical protein EJ063_08805 [Vibrio aquaticus]
MKHNLFLWAMLISMPTYADDSEHNPLARKLKSSIQKQISDKKLEGYCDLFIELDYSNTKAVVKRVSGIGDHKVCKASKKLVHKGRAHKYTVTEKYIRLHIEN